LGTKPTGQKEHCGKKQASADTAKQSNHEPPSVRFSPEKFHNNDLENDTGKLNCSAGIFGINVHGNSGGLRKYNLAPEFS
jgi:hypothetical protein